MQEVSITLSEEQKYELLDAARLVAESHGLIPLNSKRIGLTVFEGNILLDFDVPLSDEVDSSCVDSDSVIEPEPDISKGNDFRSRSRGRIEVSELDIAY